MIGAGFVLLLVTASTAAGSGQPRIVGGNAADPADWPWAAALTTPSGRQFCGGTVIAPDAVLTAAHCVVATQPAKVRVVTGRPDMYDRGAGQSLAVQAISVPRAYRRGQRHDVAVLRLAAPTSAPAAALPTIAQDKVETAGGAELRVAGWGARKRYGAKPSHVLREVSTRAIRPRPCERRFFYFKRREEICTRGAPLRRNRTSACYGDSGGPLIADSPSGALLVGVVSYGGVRCGVKDPTVFARVADNLAFIESEAGLDP